MNTNEEDKKLAQMLKQGAHDPGENPWFTRRVLNKLPEKRTRGSWATTAVYAIALVACVICWLMMWRGQEASGVITVRDVLYNVMMGVVTITVLWQTIASFLHATDL
jgi:fatty acid desaturase